MKEDDNELIEYEKYIKASELKSEPIVGKEKEKILRKYKHKCTDYKKDTSTEC